MRRLLCSIASAVRFSSIFNLNSPEIVTRSEISIFMMCIIIDGTIYGLAFDWVTKNLYGVSSNGIAFACNTTAGTMLHCVMLISGQGALYGIAVNPYEG